MEEEIDSQVSFVADSSGHRVPMRSRLEARWAVFFSRCGLAWKYEAKTFTLPSGVPYTPDFWITGVGWFEIKPNKIKLYTGRAKILEFCHSADRLLGSEPDKQYFVAVGPRPSIEDIFVGYSPSPERGLHYLFWNASKLRPLPFPTFADNVVPAAEKAAAQWSQNEVTIGEFLLKFQHQEMGIPFPKLVKARSGKEPLRLTPEYLLQQYRLAHERKLRRKTRST